MVVSSVIRKASIHRSVSSSCVNLVKATGPKSSRLNIILFATLIETLKVKQGQINSRKNNSYLLCNIGGGALDINDTGAHPGFFFRGGGQYLEIC